MRSGNDAVLRAFQLADAFHADGWRAGTFDFCSHLVEQIGQVGHFRFASAVLQQGLAFRKRRSHQQVFGACDGDLVEHDFGALQPCRGGLDVAVVLGDLGAELLEPLDMQVDGASSNGAAAGERDPGVTAAGDQRAKNERGSAHCLDQLIRSFRRGEIGAMERSAVLGASIAEFDFGPHGGEQVARGLNVAHLRNIFEDDRLVGEQGGSHAGEGGILGAADANGAEQRVATADDEFVHSERNP